MNNTKFPGIAKKLAITVVFLKTGIKEAAIKYGVIHSQQLRYRCWLEISELDIDASSCSSQLYLHHYITCLEGHELMVRL
jgi:hypothetical protein